MRGFWLIEWWSFNGTGLKNKFYSARIKVEVIRNSPVRCTFMILEFQFLNLHFQTLKVSYIRIISFRFLSSVTGQPKKKIASKGWTKVKERPTRRMWRV